MVGDVKILVPGKKMTKPEKMLNQRPCIPFVRIHPATRKKYIFVSKGECKGIVGMSNKMALELIDELAITVQNDKFQHVDNWKVGDLLLWNNQAVQHLANHDYEWPRHRSLMYRITIPEANML